MTHTHTHTKNNVMTHKKSPSSGRPFEQNKVYEPDLGQKRCSTLKCLKLPFVLSSQFIRIRNTLIFSKI
jgi:hypothetical protein